MRSEKEIREKIAFFQKTSRDRTVELLRRNAVTWLNWVLNDKSEEKVGP